MISLEALAEFIEQGLNTVKNRADLTFKNGAATLHYVFRVVADTTDYHAPEREGNTVTAYIHGILYQNGSNIETSKGGATNATLNTSLELAVPVFAGMDEDGNKELVSKVRGMLDEFFSKSGRGYIQFGGVSYSFGYNYNIAASGIRQQLPQIGDAFMFRVAQSWVFMPGGIYSDDIELTINGHAVPWATVGLMRSAVQEGDVPSNQPTPTTKNVTASTMLTINVGMTAVTGEIFDLLYDHIYGGEIPVLSVTCGMEGKPSKTYEMTFNEAALNGQIPLYASATFKLVEVL